MDAIQRKSYAKYRTNRGTYRRKAAAEAPRDMREVILMQCIVSAMILICAMGLIFVKLPMIQDMRVSVKRVLSEETTAESIEQMTGDIAAKYNGLKTSIQQIFGNGEPPQVKDEILGTQPVATPSGLAASPENDSDDSPLAVDFRIDEDVLQSIDSTESFYSSGYSESDGGEQGKKQEAPTD